MANTSYLPLDFGWNASAAALRRWFTGGVEQNTSDAQGSAALQDVEVAARAESTEPVPHAAHEDGNLGITVLAQAPVPNSFASSAAPLVPTTGKRSTRASRRHRHDDEVAFSGKKRSRQLRRNFLQATALGAIGYVGKRFPSNVDDIARRAVEQARA
ncbi:hypothetical protein EXIGLDRAFT_839048 [Exidia glandulosa HHB12029]|uniref:Uncharacterized protein n=1 Tax=Exidia glandulosa HHB12029 TaxID=1314781 RepID=A0A165FAH8_EXIGL|nr:hypothetical protein EXIGLDRAFT_839048 [Exidia glandulosa HHB12029]